MCIRDSLNGEVTNERRLQRILDADLTDPYPEEETADTATPEAP